MKHPSPINNKAKLIAALWLLLSAGFLATTLVSYFSSREAIRESIVATELPLTSDNVYSGIMKDLVRPILVSSMMSHDTFLRDWVLGREADVGQMTRYLNEVMLRYGAFTSFFVSDATNTYYQADGLLKTVKANEARDRWYFRMRDMREPYEINVAPDLTNRDKLTLFISYRVFDQRQRFIGATGIGLTVDALVNTIDDSQQRYGRGIYFVDADGRIVLTGRQGVAGEKAVHANIRDIDGLREQADAILEGRLESLEYQNGGHRHFLNVRYIPELKWHLFVVKQENEALAKIQKTLYLNLGLCAGITALTLLVVYLTVSRYQRRLEEIATTDSLTGLANRHALELLLDQGMRESARVGAPISAILLDLDRFKELNDSHGHFAGDRVLQGIARILHSSVRNSDIACRWGGEEFLIILKNTNLPASAEIANTIRARIEKARHDIDGAPVALTASAGVTTYRPGESKESFISRADALLYQAKQEGRNRVCSEAIERSVHDA